MLNDSARYLQGYWSGSGAAKEISWKMDGLAAMGELMLMDIQVDHSSTTGFTQAAISLYRSMVLGTT